MWKLILAIPLTVAIVVLSVVGGFLKFCEELLGAFALSQEEKPTKDKDKGTSPQVD